MVLFKTKAMNPETHKHTKRIEIHQSQTMTFCFLRGSLRCKGEKGKKAAAFSDFEKHKIQRRFWHRRSGVIQNQL